MNALVALVKVTVFFGVTVLFLLAFLNEEWSECLVYLVMLIGVVIEARLTEIRDKIN